MSATKALTRSRKRRAVADRPSSPHDVLVVGDRGTIHEGNSPADDMGSDRQDDLGTFQELMLVR